MKIIMREQVTNVGNLGETVVVKDGFARNYLIPQGLAYPATNSFLNLIKGEVRRKEAKDAKNKAAADILSKEMENVTVTITATVGEEDKMFGSVTSSNIAEKLHEAGFKIEKKQIQLSEPIKALGIYHVSVKLHTEVHIDVKVWVVKEEDAPEVETEAPKKKKTKAKIADEAIEVATEEAVVEEAVVEEAVVEEAVVEEAVVEEAVVEEAVVEEAVVLKKAKAKAAPKKAVVKKAAVKKTKSEAATKKAAPKKVAAKKTKSAKEETKK